MVANSTTRPDMEAPEAFESVSAVNLHAQRANEVQAARDAVIEAARELACNSYPDHCGRSVTPNRTFMNALEYALKKLGEAEMLPPEDAEPELPPRNAEWRALMSRVDHEGGC